MKPKAPVCIQRNFIKFPSSESSNNICPNGFRSQPFIFLGKPGGCLRSPCQLPLLRCSEPWLCSNCSLSLPVERFTKQPFGDLKPAKDTVDGQLRQLQRCNQWDIHHIINWCPEILDQCTRRKKPGMCRRVPMPVAC